VSAEALLRSASLALRDVEARIASHPFVAAVEAGAVPLARFGAFAAEQRLVIASDRRSFAQLAARFPEEPAGAFFLDMAAGEGVALGHLPALAAAAGGVEEPYEPRAGCQAYPAYVAWLALNGQRADVALAFLANLGAWGGACERIGAALRARYGFADDALAFFDFFATTPPGFEERCLAVVGAGLAAGEDPVLALRAARLLQAYELLWWDSLADDDG
jgi:hypothetical protein